MKKHMHGFLVVFLCALLAFTVYVLLDTFVIVRRIETADELQTMDETVTDTATFSQLSVSTQAAVTEPKPRCSRSYP